MDPEANNPDVKGGGGVVELWKQLVISEQRKIRLQRKTKRASLITSCWTANRAKIDSHARENGGLVVSYRSAPLETADTQSGEVAKLLTTKNVVYDKVTLSKMPRVEPFPFKSTWAPIQRNILADETKHTNIPYFGDEVIDQESNFIASIVEEVNATNDDEATIDDDLFEDLITVLMDDEQARTDKILKAKANTVLFRPTSDVELEYYKKSKKDSKLPPLIIFQAISAAYPDLGSTSALIKKYYSLHAQIPETNFIPNIDSPMSKEVSSERALHSYSSLLCRRCCLFDCPLHRDDPDVDSYIPKPSERIKWIRDFPLPTDPCGTNCFMEIPDAMNMLSPRTPWNRKKKLAQKSNYNPERLEKLGFAKSEPANEWSDAEMTMFRVLIKTYPANFCAVAQCMATKTCDEVYRFSIQEGKHKRAHREKKVTKGKKKSHQSHLYKNTDGGVRENSRAYFPCFHPGKECTFEECTCRQNNNFCEKFCYCSPDCRDRFPGCGCRSSCKTKACSCFFASRECDPDLCSNCLDGCLDLAPESNSCKNVLLQKKMGKKLYEAPSDIAGWGCFLGESAKEREFIAEYVGEIISQEECERRGRIYDKIKSSYMFNLNDNYSVDAARVGGKIRFANHSSKPNCQVKIVMVNGDSRIGIYAKQDIEIGEELFFDYGKDFVGHDLI